MDEQSCKDAAARFRSAGWNVRAVRTRYSWNLAAITKEDRQIFSDTESDVTRWIAGDMIARLAQSTASDISYLAGYADATKDVVRYLRSADVIDSGITASQFAQLVASRIESGVHRPTILAAAEHDG